MFMDSSLLLITLLLVPLAAALFMAVLPSKAVPSIVFEGVHLLSITGMVAVSLLAVVSVMTTLKPIDALDLWLHLDALGAIFVALIGVIGFLTGVYSLSYLRHDLKAEKLGASQFKQYYVFFNLFIFTMLLTALSNNIIMMWAAVEATTLATVFLVGTYNTVFSLEAAWKYVIVCTTGVAFGLYGTVVIYANAADIMPHPEDAVFWTSLMPFAAQFDVLLVQIAFIFAAIGFGTKAGLFPMHTWLPDAHSEAPSPVSALLSGVLLKCAMLIIIRFYTLTVAVVGSSFPQMVMLILGILSVVVAALSVFAQDDLKRKLAYHSCENIGIVALCLGFGGALGIAAAIIHCITHGITKALLFCISGNVQIKYGTRDLNKIKGILRVAPVTAVIMTIGFFGLAGFPPFAMFISEIMAFISGIQAELIPLIIVFAIALAIVIVACVHVVTGSVLGKAPETVSRGDLGIMALLPELALVALIVWFGVAMPKPVLNSVESAVSIVLQEDPTQLHETPLFKDLFGESASPAAFEPEGIGK